MKTSFKYVEILSFLSILLIVLAPSSKIIVVNFCVAILIIVPVLIEQNLKTYFPKWLVCAILLYVPFLIYGIINNKDFHIDFKFHLFSLISVLIFGTVIRRLGLNFLINSIYYICLLIAISYLLIYFLDLPRNLNVYSRGTAAAGYGYRIQGPSVVIFSIIPMLYLYLKNKWDFRLSVVSFSGLICVFLNGSFQYLILLVFLYSLVLIRRPKHLVIFPIAIYIFLKISIAVITPFANESYKTKLSYIDRPWEYPTVQHRLETLDIMIGKTTNSIPEILFGSGVGVKARYFEVNEESPSLSRYRTFQEIDNGFYYIYHRGGVLGLSIFLIFHIYIFLFLKLPLNFRIGFLLIFLITNALSIHYFTDATYTLLFLLAFKEVKLISNINRKHSHDAITA